MSDVDWSRIVKQQDEYVHEEDRRQNERRLKMKQMYKNELLKMIGQQRDKVEEQKNHDRSLMRWMNEKEKSKSQRENQVRARNQKLKQQISRYNLNSNLEKRNKITEENEEYSKFYARKYQKAITELEQEKKSRVRSRQHQKQSLAKAYDSQITVEKNKKLLQKLEDKKFIQLRQQIQRKKQQDRKFYFDRIRNSHRQNPQVYELSQNLIKQKQRQKTDFVKKLETEDKDEKAETQKKKQQQKLKKIIQASKYNRNYYEAKSIKQRLQNMQEVAEIHNQYKTLQQEMQNKREIELREKLSQRNILKDTLEKQIDEAHMRQSGKYKLSLKEERLNKSGHIARLPGILKDSSSQKHYEILYSFLGGGRHSTSVDRPSS